MRILTIMSNKPYLRAIYAQANQPKIATANGPFDVNNWQAWADNYGILAAILWADDGTVAYITKLSYGWALSFGWHGHAPIHRDRFAEIITIHNLELVFRQSGEGTDRLEF